MSWWWTPTWPSYTECPELLRKTGKIVVFDHHRQSSEIIENPILSYIEPYASSACEMVAEVLQYFNDGVKIKATEADCIYAESSSTPTTL